MKTVLQLSFNGSAYTGWQVQPNTVSVQKTVQNAIEEALGHAVKLTGCSRTDSGVHAENYVCNIKTDRAIPEDAVVRGMNSFLPSSIAVKKCEIVDDGFHARYNAVSKEYHYKILNSSVPDPFLSGRAYFLSAKLDVEKMAADARLIEGTHNFASFMASGSKIVDPTRTVYKTSVTKEGDLITFSISADGFLYNMVRIIVGTLVDLNLGRTPLTMTEIIEAQDRSKAGFTASPDGLLLYRVNY